MKISRFGAASVMLLLLEGGSRELPAQAKADRDGRGLVLSEALANAPGKRLTAVVVNYAPGGKSVKHRHAGSVFAFVLSGAVRSENSATGPARVYKAGEGFFEPEGSVHVVSENASDTEAASLLAVFVADEGATLTTYEGGTSR
jgi:quercetin dioxygenase-like cupin family protein